MNKNKTTGFISFDLLFVGVQLILIAFKLAEVGVVATMSWFWVLFPVWFVLALVFLAALGGITYGLIKSSRK